MAVGQLENIMLACERAHIRLANMLVYLSLNMRVHACRLSSVCFKRGHHQARDDHHGAGGCSVRGGGLFGRESRIWGPLFRPSWFQLLVHSKGVLSGILLCT